MSIDVCKSCDAYVDTDFDCDCYQPDDTCLCERCREAAVGDRESDATGKAGA